MATAEKNEDLFAHAVFLAEKKKARKAKYFETHKKECCEYQKEYYKKNQEYYKNYNINYRLKNKEYFRDYQRKRRNKERFQNQFELPLSFAKEA